MAHEYLGKPTTILTGNLAVSMSDEEERGKSSSPAAFKLTVTGIFSTAASELLQLLQLLRSAFTLRDVADFHAQFASLSDARSPYVAVWPFSVMQAAIST